MLCIAYLDRCTINDSNNIDLLKFPLQGQIQDLWGKRGSNTRMLAHLLISLELSKNNHTNYFTKRGGRSNP